MTFRNLRIAIITLSLFTLLTGVLYPLAVTVIAQSFFPAEANGSLIENNRTVTGSYLIGQQFTLPQYFWGRLSATTPDPYNAASSSGSNLGPSNPGLLEAIKGRITQLKKTDSTNSQLIPVDLVTSSASGLDPHISIASAFYQIPRVARARNITADTLYAIVNKLIEPRTFGFLGEPRINVLKLNLTVDALTSSIKGAH